MDSEIQLSALQLTNYVLVLCKRHIHEASPLRFGMMAPCLLECIRIASPGVWNSKRQRQDPMATRQEATVLEERLSSLPVQTLRDWLRFILCGRNALVMPFPWRFPTRPMRRLSSKPPVSLSSSPLSFFSFHWHLSFNRLRRGDWLVSSPLTVPLLYFILRYLLPLSGLSC